jgi:hypothetical protein
VPSDIEETCGRIGLLDGEKRPGLDEGELVAVAVAVAVFAVVAGSIVEMQQGESRHV